MPLEEYSSSNCGWAAAIQSDIQLDFKNENEKNTLLALKEKEGMECSHTKYSFTVTVMSHV